MFSIINKKKIKVIFRLKKTLKILKELQTNENIFDKIVKVNGIKFRVLKYVINSKDYFIGTTIFDKNLEYIKSIYWDRWKVETNFKHSKYNLSMANLKSKSKNKLFQDISIHNTIFMINSFFEQHGIKKIKQTKKKEYKINTKNSLKMIIEKKQNFCFFKIIKLNKFV